MKVVLIASLLGLASGTAVTPVQKVIQMLTGMVEKGKVEKHDEQVQFASYKQFCDDTAAQKEVAIAEAEEMIGMLKADIQKMKADAEKLTQEVHVLDADMMTWEGDVKAAAKVRAIEHADYQKTHKDYTESIDALTAAIAMLKDKMKDTPQAMSMLQNTRAWERLPADGKHEIEAFLAEPDDSFTPQANAYEWKSAGIIDMLNKLKDKFIDERTDLEKQELSARHAFDMLTQDLKASVKAAEEAKSSKAEGKAKALQQSAESSGDLKDTIATKEEDSKYLADLTSTCKRKASDFESRQALRAQELQAIEQAIEILSGGAVAGAAEKHLPSLVQKKATSFVQLRGDSAQDPNVIRVAAYLNEQALRTGSRVLSALAIRARADPFAKVKKMIKDLIQHLMASANEEAEHKGWCDTELASNEQTRKSKTSAVETLKGEIEELDAKIAKLGQDVADLTKSVAEVTSATKEAEQIRSVEKAKNTATIQDAQEAQAAVAQAITVLKEFYASAAEATALAQTHKGKQPEVFEGAYKGMGTESGGIIAMLEVIQSDFARLESETDSAESSAQKEFENFMTDSSVDNAAKNKDIEHKQMEKQNKEQTLTEKTADLETTQAELTAALEYYDKLKPSCIDQGVSYEDRVARRKEEIEALQEALKILNGQDIALLMQQ